MTDRIETPQGQHPASSDNPPLFEPVHEGGGQPQEYRTTATLRDLFAAFCAAGFVAQPEHYRPQDVGELAYEVADALLAERERK